MRDLRAGVVVHSEEIERAGTYIKIPVVDPLPQALLHRLRIPPAQRGLEKRAVKQLVESLRRLDVFVAVGGGLDPVEREGRAELDAPPRGPPCLRRPPGGEVQVAQ